MPSSESKHLFTSKISELASLEKKDSQIWCEIQKIIGRNNCFIDRTERQKSPFNFEIANASKLPSFPTSFNKSYEQICSERVHEILKIQYESESPICLLYSGGIDSTMVVISFLKELALQEFNDRIIVFLNHDSINENPNFYKKYLRGKVRIESSERILSLFDGRHLVVGADFNDQLFGHMILYSVIETYGEGILHRPYTRDFVEKFFTDRGLSKEASFYWAQYFDESIREQNFTEVRSIFDFFWWFNFIFKWQATYFSLILRILPIHQININQSFLDKKYQHFFCNADFQRWSVKNSDLKIKKTWNSYKWHVKDLIYSFNKDAEYRDEKLKIGSLFRLLLQNNCPQALTNQYKFLYKVQAEDYYNP